MAGIATMAMDEPHRHPRYYFADGSDIFLVGSTLYRLHRSIITEHSDVFAHMFTFPQPNNMSVDGQTDEQPIKLGPEISSRAFSHLLSFLIPMEDWTPGPYPHEMLIDILHLSARWEMQTPRKFALHNLSTAQLSPVLRMHLAMRYCVPEWITAAFPPLVDLPLSLYTDEDADLLGTKVLLTVVKVKDAISYERKLLAAKPPDIPARPSSQCTVLHHASTCRDAWRSTWNRKIASQLLHPDFPIRCSEIPFRLKTSIGTAGSDLMTPQCRDTAVKVLQDKKHVFAIEDTLIASGIAALETWCRRNSPYTPA